MTDEKGYSHLKVLYVEDEMYLREEIATFLKRRIGKLYLAEDGAEGVAIFQRERIDLVITDLKMPSMGGLEMAKRIREIDADVPIIITTAISDVGLMQESIEVGIERYLLKPIDVTVLVSALEAVSDKLGKKDQLKAFGAMSAAQIQQYERKIEAEIAKLVKLSSGKGPKRVICQFNANIVEITLRESRTLLENTLLETEENRRIVDYLRETYYQQLKEAIRNIVMTSTAYHAIWLSLTCDSERDEDRIKLMLEV
jgi:YesN/AraC family two-component response regulator